MALRTIVIGWWGPYALEEVQSSELENGLYFLSGRRRYERQDQIQYFGITEGLYRTFAVAFLMPRDSALRELPRVLDWRRYAELKRRWGVPMIALVR